MFPENSRMCSVVAKPLFHPHHQPCHCFKVNKLHLFKANKKSNNSSWQNNNIYHRRGNIKRFIGNTTTMATMMMRFQASMLRSPCVSPRRSSTPKRDSITTTTAAAKTTTISSAKMSSSTFMYQMEEEAAMMDLWDSSAAFLWPSSSSSSCSSGEESNESVPPLMWANEPPPTATSQWNVIDEDTVLFGDQLSSLGVEALYEEGSVIVESCLNNSSNDNSRQGNELEDDPFDQSEEQVHFFQTMHNAMEGEEKDTFMECCSPVENNEPQFPVEVAPVKDEEEEKVAEEEEEKTVASISNLLLKIEGIGGGYGNDSVVSTPDVLNDVITLESEGLCRKLKIEDSPFEIEDFSENVLELVNDDEVDCYSEYVVEYVDESQLDGASDVFTTNPSSVATTAIDESQPNTDVEEDDGDEEYRPSSSTRTERRRLRTRCNSNASSSYSGGSVKKRGRPAKPIRTHLTPRELANLLPEARKHKVERFRNNEASRLSRFKRRQKDLKLTEQCDMFESENKDLRRVLKAHKRLHSQLRELIVNIKFAV